MSKFSSEITKLRTLSKIVTICEEKNLSFSLVTYSYILNIALWTMSSFCKLWATFYAVFMFEQKIASAALLFVDLRMPCKSKRWRYIRGLYLLLFYTGKVQVSYFGSICETLTTYFELNIKRFLKKERTEYD